MTILQIDIETYSEADIKKVGAYRYVDDPSFEILMIAYAIDDEPVQIVDLLDFEELPLEIRHMLTDPSVIKTAFNANFERTCLAKWYKSEMDPKQWRCTAVHALTLGMPGTLEMVAKTIDVPMQKDTAGKALIKYFSCPCKPTKVNGGRTRNMPEHAPEKWSDYLSYCKQDVETERAVRKWLTKYPVPENEWELWALDQRINDRGVRLEPELVRHAITCDALYKERLTEELKEITELDNPNSGPQLKAWLLDNGLDASEGITKETRPQLLADAPNETVRRVIEINSELGKTSVTKYQAMERSICSDEWARGLLQFCGANRTWRWAGRIIQVQNLPQNKVGDLELARKILLSGDYEYLELLFGSPPFILSQLIRTTFIPSDGCRFVIADFSAIEARVIAWLANEMWRLAVFATHGKIYEASAAQMFKIPIESIGKTSIERQKGKVAELALGYGGGVGALIAMGALKKGTGLSEEDLQPLVNDWRFSNPMITKLWWDVGDAALKCVKDKKPVKLHHGIYFVYEPGLLMIRLPSGRKLSYVNPKIVPGKFGKDQVSYEGTDPETKRWGRTTSYGPKFVENIVQAISRDCLGVAMVRLDKAGYKIGLHVHDEVVIDEPIERDSLADIVDIMGQSIPWAPDLLLRADAFEATFYKKD